MRQTLTSCTRKRRAWHRIYDGIYNLILFPVTNRNANHDEVIDGRFQSHP